jgi:hypothetical protein
MHLPAEKTSRYSSACSCWGIKSGSKSYKRDSLIHLLALTPASRSLLPQSAPAPRFHPRLALGYHLLAHVFRPMSSLCCCALTVSPSFQPGAHCYEGCALDPNTSDEFVSHSFLPIISYWKLRQFCQELLNANSAIPIDNNGIASLTTEVIENLDPFHFSKPDNAPLVLHHDNPCLKEDWANSSAESKTLSSRTVDRLSTLLFILPAKLDLQHRGMHLLWFAITLVNRP